MQRTQCNQRYLLELNKNTVMEASMDYLSICETHGWSSRLVLVATIYDVEYFTSGKKVRNEDECRKN